MYLSFHSYFSPRDRHFKGHFVGVAFKSCCLCKIGVSYSGHQAGPAPLFGNGLLLLRVWLGEGRGPTLDTPWLKRAASSRSVASWVLHLPLLPVTDAQEPTRVQSSHSSRPTLRSHSVSRAHYGVGLDLLWDLLPQSSPVSFPPVHREIQKPTPSSPLASK